MTFILKMAWRDSRASRRRLLLFSLSVVLGIAALVAIGSFTVNLKQAIDDQAKGLLGADLVVSSRATFTEPVLAYLGALGGERSRTREFSSMMVFPTAADATRLVQVRAVEKNFPFFGDFETEPADAPAKLRAGGLVVILEETLLTQFGVIAEFEGDLLKHTLATLLIDERGKIIHRADGSAWEPKDFVAKLKKS
jgi:putative ABC transport system permease protein